MPAHGLHSAERRAGAADSLGAGRCLHSRHLYSEPELLADYEIQAYHVTGLEAVYQVIEHFGLHYGQIAYATKMLRDQDLGFYRELNKTGRLDKPVRGV